MSYQNLSKEELVMILNIIEQLLKDKPNKHSNNIKNYKTYLAHRNVSSNNVDNELKKLIGTLPFLLLNESIFQKNSDIADFATKIGVEVPFATKRGKEEIIGRVISSIAKFNNSRIILLNKMLKELEDTETDKSKESFLSIWDNIIKNTSL